MGEGCLALWPMIKPDGHAAGVKSVELGVMTVIRNAETSVLV